MVAVMEEKRPLRVLRQVICTLPIKLWHILGCFLLSLSLIVLALIPVYLLSKGTPVSAPRGQFSFFFSVSAERAAVLLERRGDRRVQRSVSYSMVQCVSRCFRTAYSQYQR